jgi:Pyruvate/2-oxoacid:ferredoxin oxidoreductase delta subunit
MLRPSSENFYTKKRLKEIADEIEHAVTIPVNTMIEAEHLVLDLSEVRRFLEEAERIVVQDCGCRTEYDNCDSPLDVCIGLDDEAEYALKNTESAREIEIDEALDVLRRSHEAGLVHMAYLMKGEEKPGLICSCCSCCCHTLGGLLKYGIHAQVLTSRMIAEGTRSKCTDCGECVARCVFRARSMIDGGLQFDPKKCYGCGLCVTACPTEAIMMVSRE